MVGMTLRYLTDFSIFFNLAAACAILARYGSGEAPGRVSGLVVALCCCTVLANLLDVMGWGCPSYHLFPSGRMSGTLDRGASIQRLVNKRT